MKKIIKNSLKKLYKDKYLLVLVICMLLMALSCAIIVGLNVHPRDLQLPSRYSAYGITHFYTAQWFYLLVFVVFGIIVAVSHSAIAIKLLITKGHSLAIVYAWSGLGVIVLGLLTALSVLNVQKIL